MSTSLERQAEILGFTDIAGQMSTWIVKAAEYNWNLIVQTCTGAAKHPSERYLEAFFDVIPAARLLAIWGQYRDYLAMEQACMERVKLNLAGNIDSTTDNGQWTEHVVARATATVKGTAQPALASNNPVLIFDTAESTADAQLQSENGTAATTSSNGTMYGSPQGATATKAVRCENGKLILERHAFIYVPALDLWTDNETVEITVNGNPAGSLPSSAVSQSWHEMHNSKDETIKLQIGGPSDKETHSGKCANSDCVTYAYTSKLTATSQSN